MDNKIEIPNLDAVIKKVISAIEGTKNEIYDIAENARKEVKKLEEELVALKQRVVEIISEVDRLEGELKDSKRKLLLVNKNFEKYTQEDLKEAYERADNLRVTLAVKREQEQVCIARRNELEIRIKDSIKTVQKAENLISSVGAAINYLTGDLKEVSLQLENFQQKQLLGVRIIKAQEEERHRVAREIHDGPAQSMSNVVLKAEYCEKLIDVDVEKAKDELKQLKKIIRDTLQDVRRIIYDLRPMSLDDLGLTPTLQRYLSVYKEESGTNVTFRTRGNCEQVKPAVSLTVFRVVQEAVNNIKKHAHAANVSVGLEFINDKIKIYITDDGKGFDIESLKVRRENIDGGFGLFSMKERIELLNGEFIIDSQPGKGTRLNVTIPLLEE